MDFRRILSRWMARKPEAATNSLLTESAEPSTGAASGPNARAWAAVESFLADTGAPRHALLLDGPWGVGKTHFQAAIKRDLGKDKVWLYVSLYGVSSKADIDNAVFAALYPFLTGNGAAVVGALGNAALRFVNIDLKIDPQAIFDRRSIDVIVFDDLERSALKPDEILGYINGYVEHEHDDLKVMILANLDEFVEQEEFRRIREKVIGRTIRLQPDFDAAFPSFLDAVRDPIVRDHLRSEEEVFRRRFHESEIGNLRLVHQSIAEIGRLVAAMEPAHRADRELFKAVVELVFILSIELRSARIQVTDLSERRVQWVRGAVDGEATAVRVLSERYPGSPLIESPLSDEVLKSLLVDGVVDGETVRFDLNHSRWFVDEHEAAWRRAWRSHELPDDVVEAAIDEMNQTYQSHGYELAGEILHVLGLRLWLADIGRIKLSRSEAEADGRAYIDAVRDSGALESPSRDLFTSQTGFGGLGYTQAESAEFKRLAAYLAEQQVVADKRRRPGQAAELFQELKADFELFSRRIINNGDKDSHWARVPILQHLDAEAFADWLVDQHPAHQRAVLMSLSIRYDHGSLKGDLAEERTWVEDLRDALERRAVGLAPVSRDRITNNIKWLLTPKLDALGHDDPQP